MIREFEMNGPLSVHPVAFNGPDRLHKALRGALDQANGSSAYGGAFILLPSGMSEVSWTMEEVNSASWKEAYPDDVRGTWFFAVDVMGNPFGIRGEEIIHLDLETGLTKHLASKLGEFLAVVQADPDEVVSLDYFDEWFGLGRTLELRERLVAKIPIIMGGGREAADYEAMDLMLALEQGADIYRQTKDLPDGTKVRFG